MKLKSKLIATIVSICAAIAVMGVGVWAATSSFTINVTNTVTISATNLTGTIDVSATATGTELKAEPTKSEYEATLFNSASSTTTSASITATEFDGVNLLSATYIDEDTTAANVVYTFTYTPVEGTASTVGTTDVAVNVTEFPTIRGAADTLSFNVTIKTGATANAATEAKNQDITAVSSVSQTGVTADQVIVVIVTLDYDNANKLSVSSTGNFTFNVVFTAQAAAA